jgi:hypothetical protein
VLTAIGLVLDAIGAIVLVLGLFRGPIRAVYGGILPPPRETASEDRAYGTVGGPYLFLGFLLQLLASFGVAPSASTGARVAVASGTALLGGAAAKLAYEFLRPWYLRRLQSDSD